MDPRALDTDQRAQVETGPSGICGGVGVGGSEEAEMSQTPSSSVT